jgi:hypothetical protein
MTSLSGGAIGLRLTTASTGAREADLAGFL